MADEEFLPFAPASFALVVASLSLQWITYLPGARIDLRQAREIEKHGAVDNAIRVPFRAVSEAARPAGARSASRGTNPLVFLFAYGQRSAMARPAAKETGVRAAGALSAGPSESRQ